MTDLRQTYYSNGYFQSSSNHIPFFLTNTSEFISFTKDLLTFLSLYQRSVPLQSPLAIVTLLTMAVLPSSPTVPHALLLSCTMLQQLWVFLLPRQDNTAPPRILRTCIQLGGRPGPQSNLPSLCDLHHDIQLLCASISSLNKICTLS